MKIPDNTVVRDIHFPESISGASMVKGDTWCVGVSDRLDSIVRDRMIAHELGHLYDGTCGIVHPLAERRADEFARNILISISELRRYVEDGFTTIHELHLFFPSATPEMIEKTCRELY